MKRREFITLIGGGVAAWPLAARAQQAAMPVVGYLSVGAPVAHLLAVFKQSLAEAGFAVVDRDPFGRWPLRSPASASCRPGAAPSGGDRRNHQ
jgi:hypothetical protein